MNGDRAETLRFTSGGRAWLAVAATGADAVRLHPLRSVVTMTALVCLIAPYLIGIAVARGVLDQARVSLVAGADLYVTAHRLGREVPVPLRLIGDLEALEGVEEITPRIVAGITLGRDAVPAVLVGLARRRLPASVQCLEGRLFEEGAVHELVVGTQLASRLALKVGSMIPPFYHGRRGEKLSRVVGIFRTDLPVVQANLMFTSFESAARIMDQEGVATDLLVRCRPGYEGPLAARIARIEAQEVDGNPLALVARTREELEATLPRAIGHREGLFTLHFVLGFAVGIPILLVTSGLGHGERQLEIGILKATGWHTDQVLFRGLVESFLLSAAGACLAYLITVLWLRVFNGWGIAAALLPGVASAPPFPVPARLGPLPLLLSFVLSFALVMTGTLYSIWRTARVPPREVLR